MKTKKPKLMMRGHTDEVSTPKYALNPLLPYLKKKWIIWECAWGVGNLGKYLIDEGFKVVGSRDFFNENKKFSCIVTNPPYSLKDEFLERCFKLNKPFALLMPLTALEGIKRGELYRKYGIQLIIPNRRIDFIMPNKQGSAWFQVAWFCWKLNLPNDLNFVELNKGNKNENKKKQ